MFEKKYMIVRIFFSAVIALLLFGALLGLPHFGMSSIDEHGNMTLADCSMPGMTTLCTMSPLEHLSSWQLAFASILKEFTFALLAMLLFVAITLAIAWVRQRYSTRDILFSRYRLGEESLPPTQLQELFSNGILNPKPF